MIHSCHIFLKSHNCGEIYRQKNRKKDIINLAFQDICFSNFTIYEKNKTEFDSENPFPSFKKNALQ